MNTPSLLAIVDGKGKELCSDESVMDCLELEHGYNGSRGA